MLKTPLYVLNAVLWGSEVHPTLFSKRRNIDSIGGSEKKLALVPLMRAP